MSHIIILKKLQNLKMKTRTANQSEKIPKKKNPKPSSQQIYQTHCRQWVWPTQAGRGSGQTHADNGSGPTPAVERRTKHRKLLRIHKTAEKSEPRRTQQQS
jgi:hypothetical protein